MEIRERNTRNIVPSLVGAAALLTAACGGPSADYRTDAIGLQPGGSCTDWTLSNGQWTGPIDAVVTAVLQRADGQGGWVDACTDQQRIEIGDRANIDWGMLYPHDFAGRFSCPITTGQHRVSFTVDYHSIYDASAPIWSLQEVSPGANEPILECTGSSWAPRTPGYWRNHASAWPVSQLELGDTTYSQACLLDFFDVPVRGDLRVKLIHQLTAAKLNLLNGSDGRALGTTVDDADQHLIDTGTRIDCRSLRLSGRAGDRATTERLKTTLDTYNNGNL
jgi:hypothetical protein